MSLRTPILTTLSSASAGAAMPSPNESPAKANSAAERPANMSFIKSSRCDAGAALLYGAFVPTKLFARTLAGHHLSLAAVSNSGNAPLYGLAAISTAIDPALAGVTGCKVGGLAPERRRLLWVPRGRRGVGAGARQRLAAELEDPIVADDGVVDEVHVVQNDRTDDRNNQRDHDRNRRCVLHCASPRLLVPTFRSSCSIAASPAFL